ERSAEQQYIEEELLSTASPSGSSRGGERTEKNDEIPGPEKRSVEIEGIQGGSHHHRQKDPPGKTQGLRKKTLPEAFGTGDEDAEEDHHEAVAQEERTRRCSPFPEWKAN